MTHTFHIPVLGLAFSIDSPIKVAQFGISSVMSIVDDELIERMRKYYATQVGKVFHSIYPIEEDFRAKRITAYLDLVQDIVSDQIQNLKNTTNAISDQLKKYIDLQSNDSAIRTAYQEYLEESSVEKKQLILTKLLSKIEAGDIDVNIMSKVDKINYNKKGNALDTYYSDANAALRGFANSKLKSSVVLSAGMNPRLYSYLSELPQFLSNENGDFDKKIILKVSDFRSAFIQAKFLAKKGIWISEYRIESGLNCGGHAFATDGFLLGPILQEFKEKRAQLLQELFPLYQNALAERQLTIEKCPSLKFTAQGGIGTAAEQDFLMNYYQLDATGWGSPFLLVPEATTVDQETLDNLAAATKDDFYSSGASPLGVPFNNFRKSAAELKRIERIEKDRPGAPCTKKYLATNGEYTEEPICTASRVFQYTKIKELEISGIETDSLEYAEKLAKIIEKTCLCEGLASAAYIKYDIVERKDKKAVAICPGPNTAYFNKVYTLQEMVDHIYGRQDLLENVDRPHVFINEIHLYIEHLQKFIENNVLDDKKLKYVQKFKDELLRGITYYRSIAGLIFEKNFKNMEEFKSQLTLAEDQINPS